MYLHFNGERARNLFCTIDLMMWPCGKLVHSQFLDMCLFFVLDSSAWNNLLSSLQFIIAIEHEAEEKERSIPIIIRYTCTTIHCYSLSFALALSILFLLADRITSERKRSDEVWAHIWLTAVSNKVQTGGEAGGLLNHSVRYTCRAC